MAIQDLAAPTLRLPEGSILVHIGPHKTGTTSLQAAFRANREGLARQGVIYAGRGSKAGDAVRAVLGLRDPSGSVPPMRAWQDLVDESTSASRGRTVISNEFLSEASPEAIRTIARDLDPTRIHVVATLRPLDRILPSQWQQFIQGGSTKPFDEWLDEMLAAWATPANRFWRRHRHDLLLARWASVVGPERVTAIVVDEGDPTSLFRVFEDLVGLPAQTLMGVVDVQNRSLTWAEVEIIRALNEATRAGGMDPRVHYRLIERGVCESMKRRVPGVDEPRVTVPAEAIERVLDIERSVVAGIRATEVGVVGDLDDLAPPRDERAAGGSAPGCIEPRVAAAVSMGVLEVMNDLPGRGPAAAPDAKLPGVPTRRIAGEICRRPARAARARLRRVAGRPTPDRGA